MSRVQQIPFDTFEDFENFIYEINCRNLQPYSFVYRGQSEDWPLIPSIFRDCNIDMVKEYSDFDKESFKFTEAEYRSAEDNILLNFYNLSNRNGLRLPLIYRYGNRHINDIYIKNFKKILHEDWIPDDLVEFAALAQHYGIPTRLLDWTYDINVALYFASFGAIKSALKNGNKYTHENIVIWLLGLYNVNRYNLKSRNNDLPLHFVVPSYYNNLNLNAQKGILSYWVDYSQSEKTKHDLLSVHIDKTTLDKKIIEFEATDIGESELDNILTKIQISSKECVKISKYLFNIGYNSAKIFPGYNGIVQAMEEKQLIKQAKELLEQ